MTYSPIGYYINCDDALCADDAPEGFGQGDYSQWAGFEGWDAPLAIFPDAESDTPTHCVECGTLIDHNLTGDGFDYVSEALGEFLTHGRGSREVLTMWRDAYGQYADAESIVPSDYLDRMVAGYAECALWSSLDISREDGGNNPPLDENFDTDDLSDETSDEFRADCLAFAAENVLDLGDAVNPWEPGQAGHDFWLTRNGHGAGFWDRGMGERGENLTKAAHAYGTVDLYAGDDGLIYA